MSVVLSVPTENVYAWTDSRVVLGWLRGNPPRFKIFVGNRVSEILDLVSPNAWRHVASKDNPADFASIEECILVNWQTISCCGTVLNGYDYQKRTGQRWINVQHWTQTMKL